jgi:hypothetical protein
MYINTLRDAIQCREVPLVVQSVHDFNLSLNLSTASRMRLLRGPVGLSDSSSDSPGMLDPRLRAENTDPSDFFFLDVRDTRVEADRADVGDNVPDGGSTEVVESALERGGST